MAALNKNKNKNKNERVYLYIYANSQFMAAMDGYFSGLLNIMLCKLLGHFNCRSFIICCSASWILGLCSASFIVPACNKKILVSSILIYADFTTSWWSMPSNAAELRESRWNALLPLSYPVDSSWKEASWRWCRGFWSQIHVYSSLFYRWTGWSQNA